MRNIKIGARIDHLIYTTSRLEAGCDEVERILGVRPVLGGSHPQWSTHNAVLSLGNMTYLEVISLDPNASTKFSPIMGIGHGETELLKFATWACTTQLNLD